MSEKGKTTPDQNENGSSIDQIKSLIFGGEISKFNDRFKALENQLNEQKRLFNETIQLLSEEVAGNLSNLDTSVQAKLEANKKLFLRDTKKLDAEKVDRKKIAELLQKMANEV